MVYSYRHHIIPLHEWRWRINPKAKRNDKDFNAPNNAVWLSLEQHIQVHQLLYELNGSEFDTIAWQTLSGKIGKEEAMWRANSHAHTKPHSKEHKKKNGDSHRGKKKSTESVLKSALGHSKIWTFLDPNDNQIQIFNLKKFSRDHDLDQGHMVRVYQHKRRIHKGYRSIDTELK